MDTMTLTGITIASTEGQKSDNMKVTTLRVLIKLIMNPDGFSSEDDVERNPMLQTTKCAHSANHKCLQVYGFPAHAGKYQG